VRGGLTLLAVCCALAALSTGCGDDASTSSAGDSRPAAAVTEAQTQTAENSPPRLDTVHGVVPNPLKEPSRLRPHPHAQLDHVVVRDLKKGHGPAARDHDYVFMDYIEADYRRGFKFYRSWGGPPYGTAGVILTPTERWRGMVIGMRGMRPGGHRRILVPPRLAGIEPRHSEYGTVVYWDVVLLKILARGCTDDASRCRSVAP
jgi:hypothetical protein